MPDEARLDEDYYDQSPYFNRGAAVFTDLGSPFQRYRIAKVLEIYAPGPDETVLDLGCGWGTFSFALASLCKHVTGVDFSQRSTDLCNETLATKAYANVRFVCADAQDTGFDAESVDVIICADLVEHLYPDGFERVMNECRRLLRRGGKLVLWTPHRGHIFEILKNHNIILKRDESHVDYKSMPRLLDALTTRRFTVLKHYYVESHFPVIKIIERLFGRFVPILRRRIAILAEKAC